MKRDMEFVILHTNDLHSEFESLPRVRTFFRAYEREQPPERLLRFDIGDHMDRKRPETEGTMGAVNIDVMNRTGYDAAVPGNNEGLTFPRATLDELYGRRAAFPVLAANLRPLLQGNGRGEEQNSWVRPSIVLERSGIRFGIVGLTAAYNDFYKELGWEASDPISAALRETARLRASEKADVIIVLSHLGLPDDRRLAREVPGIDLILGGHTHHLLLTPETIGNTRIAAAGKFGTHAGVLRLIVDGERRRVVHCEGRAVELSAFAPDPELAQFLKQQGEYAVSALNREVASLRTALPADVAKESPLGNLLAGTLRRYFQAEIGIVNAGQLLGGLIPGPVTELMLHTILPSPINPCFMMLRGRSIWQAVEESLQQSFIYQPIRGFGFRGTVLGTLCLDGITVKTAHSASGEPAVQEILAGGEPLRQDRWYRVGTIDMFTFNIGYKSLSEGDDIAYRLPEFLRDLLGEALASPYRDRWIQEAKFARFLRDGI